MNEIQTRLIDEPAAVSVVIVNFNAGDLLLDSVKAALSQAKQVIVVDNASSDSSLKMLEEHIANEPRLQILQTGSNLGFASACNIGIRHCAEPFILFLNPDCILRDASLRHMQQTLEEHPDAGMVGGLLLDPDGVEQGGGRRAVPTPWRSFVRAFGLSKLASRWPSLFYDFHLHKQPLPNQPIDVEAISGALMLVRRTAMEEVGIWDDAYFLHCEDLDWCMRYRQNGWRILFDAQAPAIHIHGACSVSRPVFVEWHKHKGMVRFYRKFFKHQYPGILMWMVIAGIWIRFSMVATIKSFNRDKAVHKSIGKADLARASVSESAMQAARLELNAQGGMRKVAVIGASSMVGGALVTQLVQSGVQVIAYSRKSKASHPNLFGVEWREMATLSETACGEPIQDWIWLAPIKILPAYLERIGSAGAKHVVAVSTTSRFTKIASSSEVERAFVADVISAEEKLQRWAADNAIFWTILRPTLIYGFQMDKNVSTIAKFIERFHFFPTLGKATGLRQPVHARDVAAACRAAVARVESRNRAYNVSGAEVLTYREMVERIFQALAKRPRLVAIPLWLFGLAVAVLRVLPRYRSWSAAMAERMNQDMAFDHEAATRDLGYAPQRFRLDEVDLPPR